MTSEAELYRPDSTFLVTNFSSSGVRETFKFGLLCKEKRLEAFITMIDNDCYK